MEKSKRKRHFLSGGITRRWLLNSVSVIFTILLAIIIGISISVQNFYKGSVEQALDYHVSDMQTSLTALSSLSSAEAAEKLHSFIDNFADSDTLELMLIDQEGKIAVTTSGFPPVSGAVMPDVAEAIRSQEGLASYTGKTESGEQYMAVSLRCPVYNPRYSAVRFVVSLQNAQNQVVTIVSIISLVGLITLFFVMFSNSYFISSIVIPVGEIGKVAKKIASGDFKARISNKYNDEIGELGDTINYMADELGRAEKMKNDFISSVSHELRTPLTAIKGWGETLTETAYPPDSKTVERGMKVILSETERLQSMVEELLDFSRVQSGRLTLIQERLDVLAELEETVIMYSPKASRDNIELSCELPDTVSPVMGDKNRLRQVFVNIIDNAIKYSDSGGSVLVSAYEKHGFIIITVEDKGCGISEEDLPRIKTKFFKANYTRRGSGIGLAVADEIVKLHGGTLDIGSVLGEGTTVTIKLPVMMKKLP